MTELDAETAWRGALAAYQTNRHEEAEAQLGIVLSAAPNYGPAWHVLARLRIARGERQEAREALQRAVAAHPGLSAAHNDLGALQQMDGHLAEAAASYRKAIEGDPNHAEAHCNLGIVLCDLGKPEDAIPSYRRALLLRPAYEKALGNLGSALIAVGEAREAIDCFRRAVSLNPRNAAALGKLASALNYSSNATRDESFETHKAWGSAIGESAGTGDSDLDRATDPNRRLKIGYVSADFRAHSVSFFFEPLLEAHDRRVVEVFCYSNVERPDAVTARLERLADCWLSIAGWDDNAVADRIRADGIDILVDLSGHTAGNRLKVFMRRPAPVQVSWLGYPNTTGLATMDYRITDCVADVENEADRFYVEQLHRLPRPFLSYRAFEQAPAVVSVPARRRGSITFGCFNRLLKVTDEALSGWRRILDEIPGSRLLIKAIELSDSRTVDRYRSRLKGEGIDADRVEVLPLSTSFKSHLAQYGEIDIALDTFPYNGTTTTCEALWMGVPVVSLRGDRHAARVGAALLTSVGLGDLIAETPDAYVERAVALARNVERLEALRQDLREKVQTSSLCDAVGFARSMEAAYRVFWKRWCEDHAIPGAGVLRSPH